jgi:hypothetical protein
MSRLVATLLPSAAMATQRFAKQEPGVLARMVDGFYRLIERVCLTVFGWCLRRRQVVALSRFAALFAIGPLAKSVILLRCSFRNEMRPS